jgi:predicted DNA-binding transcriptional regulator YafY
MVIRMTAYLRIKWLHNELMQNRYPNGRKVSTHFEISHRQGQRDIEYMRDSLGAPLEYSAKNRGYYYSKPFLLPVFYLSEEENVFFKKLAEYYDGLSSLGMPEYARYADAFKKITSAYPQKSGPQALIPYTAKIRFTGERRYYRLLDRFYRGNITEDISVYEFYNIELFLGLLLTCGQDFTVLFPKWLGEKLCSLAAKTLKNNSGATL